MQSELNKIFWRNIMNRKAVWLFVLMTTLAVYAQAQHDRQFDNERDFTWDVDGRTVIITGYVGRNTDIRIPRQINGMPVARIGPSAFENRRLTSVVIPDSVTSIGNQAFANNSLVSVTISHRLTSIGAAAFARNRLTHLTIPDGVTYIGEAAFANNTSLTSVIIPDTLRSLNESVFAGSLGNFSWISIGPGVSLNGDSSASWRGFSAAYASNRQRAGVYVFNNGDWAVLSR